MGQLFYPLLQQRNKTNFHDRWWFYLGLPESWITGTVKLNFSLLLDIALLSIRTSSSYSVHYKRRIGMQIRGLNWSLPSICRRIPRCQL